jgi:hypothetical protein
LKRKSFIEIYRQEFIELLYPYPASIPLPVFANRADFFQNIGGDKNHNGDCHQSKNKNSDIGHLHNRSPAED